MGFKGSAYTQSEPVSPLALEKSRVLFSGEKQNLGNRNTNLISLVDSPGGNKADYSVKPKRVELRLLG